jgi:hypothetical protein
MAVCSGQTEKPIIAYQPRRPAFRMAAGSSLSGLWIVSAPHTPLNLQAPKNCPDTYRHHYEENQSSGPDRPDVRNEFYHWRRRPVNVIVHPFSHVGNGEQDSDFTALLVNSQYSIGLSGTTRQLYKTVAILVSS